MTERDPFDTALRGRLHEELNALDVPDFPAEAVGAQQPSTMRRRTVISAAAASVVGLAVVGAEIERRRSPSDATVGAPPATPRSLTSGGWTSLAALPLTPRSGLRGVRVGDRAVFLGGLLGLPCPPNASCLAPTHWPDELAILEGAGWRTGATGVKESPVSGAVAVGDRVILTIERQVLGLDPENDRVAALTTLPTEMGPLTTDGSRLFGVSGSDEGGSDPARVQVFTLASGSWTTLPPDPLGASFDRLVIWTDAGLVLLAKKLVASPGGADGPSFVRAALFADGAWRRLPDLDCIGGWSWHWTGTRLVAPQLGSADGGEIDGYGRAIPFGGWLDPVTGASGPLPNTPATEAITQWVDGPADGDLLVVQGWLYDDAAGTWTALTRPPGGDWIDSAGVLMGRRLIVAGGYDAADDYRSEAGLTNAAWAIDL